MKINLENNIAIDVGVIILDDSASKTISVQLPPYLKPLVLWKGTEYDQVGDYTQHQVEDKIKELITTITQLTSLYISPPINNNKIYKIFTNPLDYKYDIPTKKDTLIIIAYFSPCNYAKPKNNLQQVITKLVEYKHPVCVIEAIMPNADPLVLPESVLHHKIIASNKSYMFLKENLYNIAVQKYNYDKYIFLDSDIFFDKSDWFDQTSILLDSHDIIQPFENAFWINKEHNEYVLARQSSAKCLVKKAAPSGTMYHPGMAWAVTAEFLNKIGGFFDQCIIGGGDLALWYGLDNYSVDPIKNMAGTIAEGEKNHNMFYQTTNFHTWNDKIKSLYPKIAYLFNSNIYHLYHGSRNYRLYDSRHKLLPLLDSTGNYPISKNKNGLYEWRDSKYSKVLHNYFMHRREDD